MQKKIFLVLFAIATSEATFAGNGDIKSTFPEIKKQARKSLPAGQTGIQNQSMQFIENKGQMTDIQGNPANDLLFRIDAGGVYVYITTRGLSYVFVKVQEEKTVAAAGSKVKTEQEENIRIEYCRADMELKGASIKKKNIVKEYESQDFSNYYLGHCPDGILNVRRYGKITIKEVYPKIDWVIYTDKNMKIKYDFIVHPGGNPDDIKLQYKGTDKPKKNDDGSLSINTLMGNITEGLPYSYMQETNSPVQTSYKINKETNEISFQTKNYKAHQTLIIDPQLFWSTFFGGTGLEGFGESIATDLNGNVFVLTAYCSSGASYPLVNSGTYFEAGGNMCINKFDNNGLLLWATYYSGGNINAMGICIDPGGNVFVTGSVFLSLPTWNPGGSAYFQVANAGGKDAFILKFTNAGTQLWATYYGGSGNDEGRNICTDPSGNVFVTGETSSTDFPTLNPLQVTNGGGAFDVFFLKFTNAGVPLWATYYGGSGSEGGNNFGDYGSSICTDASGNLFATGVTRSTDFPFLDPGAPAYFVGTYSGGGVFGGDVYILKFSNTGTLLWATYYGGTGEDSGFTICSDLLGNVFVTGWTESADFPTLDPGGGAYYDPTYNGGDDAFILKFSNTGTPLWATYYGGTSIEQYGSADNIAIDKCNNVYVSFTSRSTNIPVQAPCDGTYFDGTNNVDDDQFITKFSNTGIPLWATFFAGDSRDKRESIAVDPWNNLFLSGEWGVLNLGPPTNATYPLSDPGGAYYDDTYNSGDDGFIAKFTPTLMTLAMMSNTNCVATATVTATSACPPYSYMWNTIPVQTNQTATGLSAGTYTVMVTNSAFDCQTATVTITQPVILTSTIFSTNPNCNGGGTGSASVTAGGGTSSYTYSWSPSGGNSSAATGLSLGDYTVTITDANGCTGTQTVAITQPTALTLSTTTTPPSCAASNGAATASASGGTLGYTYSWSNGQTTATSTGLSGGSYTVTVTDGNGCTNSTVVLLSTVPTVSVTISSASVTCAAGSNGSASATVLGGTPNYTYAWSSGQTTSALAGLPAGNYNITVTDANGCVSVMPVTIAQPAALTASLTSTAASCSGGNNGSASVTAGGGTSSYTYLWSPSGGNSSAATGLSLGDYTVTITDANGCTGTQTVAITQPTALTVTTTTTPPSCAASNGAATASASGGTSGYTYSWSNGQTTATSTGLSGGAYTVTVTDGNNCMNNTVVLLSTVPTVSVTINSASVTCTGGSNGSASATVLGGTPNYTYAWNSGQSTSAVTGLSAGNYNITVTDASGCVSVVPVTIDQPTALTASIGSSTSVNCNGGTGSASVTAGGGTPSYTYLWSPSGGNSSMATALLVGNYTITLTDANGCTQTQTIVITGPTALTVTTSTTNANCVGNNGTALLAASGGTPSYTYSWNPTNQTTPTATGLATGTYTATVTDGNGCTQTQTVTVTSIGGFTLTASSTPTGCTVSNGTAVANPTNGSSPYTYSWSNNQTTQTATGLAAGTYSVTVTDANGCTETQTVSVTQTPGPTATASASPISIPLGASTTLSATGTGNYQWSPATGLSCTACANPVATPSQTTLYCVVVTDANGCSASACITINVDIPCGTLFIPNAFSPNNDGQNEMECVMGGCIQTLYFAIYDRWGEKVFETTNPKICWDGMYKDKLLDSAVFVYYMKATLTSGKEITKKGNISLIR